MLQRPALCTRPGSNHHAQQPIAARQGPLLLRPRHVLPPVRFAGLDRPAADPELGARVAAAYDNTPPEQVAEIQLRKFLGLSSARALQVARVSTGIKGADASLAVVGTIIEVNDLKHAMLAVVVKQNTNANKLPELTLHWAMTQHEGGQWVPPPAGCHHYPSNLMSGNPGGGAWRTPFALHDSPDGKPLHALVLQLPLEGVLSSGGITFVLSSGEHWMHHSYHGRDWYVQLSGHLPITTDLQGLPDQEVFSEALVPVPRLQEEEDRALLRAAEVQAKELRKQQAATEKLADAAGTAAQSAAAAAADARDSAQAAARVTKAARDTAQVLMQALNAGEASIATATAHADKCSRESKAADAAAAAAVAKTAVMHLDSSLDGGSTMVAEAKCAEAKAAAVAAAADAAWAAVKAIQAAQAARQAELQKAEGEVVTASIGEEAAQARLSQAEEGKRVAEKAARKQAAATIAACEGVAAELRALEAARDEAAARVWTLVEGRQLLTLQRFLAQQGPQQPLRLSWLHSAGRSGRSLPPVPTALNGVRNVAADMELEGSWQKLQSCSVQDLQLVVRSTLRKWLQVTASQEVHVIQHSCSTRLPNGTQLPVMVWMTDGKGAQPQPQCDSTTAIVVIAVDQAAAGSRAGRLQLLWGAAVREGAAPAELVGPGWQTSACHTWEANGCTLVTPFTAQRVPALGIGQWRSSQRRQPPSPLMGVSEVSGDYCVLSSAAKGPKGGGDEASGGGGGASDTAGDDGGQAVLEKQAHVVLLHLPLEGMLMHGGLAFEFKDACGSHLVNAASGKPFFLELGFMAEQLAYITAPRVYLPEPDEGEDEAVVEAKVVDGGVHPAA